MRDFKPTGNKGFDAEEYAQVVFDNAIMQLIEKLLLDIEESGISAEMAEQVPEWLADSIKNRNKMFLTVNKFNCHPEGQADAQWRQK